MYFISHCKSCKVRHRDFFFGFDFTGVTGLGETLADGIFFFMFSAGFLKTDKTKSMHGLLYDLLSPLAKAINTMIMNVLISNV